MNQVFHMFKVDLKIHDGHMVPGLDWTMASQVVNMKPAPFKKVRLQVSSRIILGNVISYTSLKFIAVEEMCLCDPVEKEHEVFCSASLAPPFYFFFLLCWTVSITVTNLIINCSWCWVIWILLMNHQNDRWLWDCWCSL